jgi:acyl-CoA synthetase (AMP-forming)/AMP-acid ligase II
MNLWMLLEMAVEGAGDRVLIGSTRDGLTAAQLEHRARNAAARFAGANVGHVGLVDVNSEAVAIALFGAALAGLPFASVNYRLADDQLAEIFGRLAPAHMIVGRDMIKMVERAGTGADLAVTTREQFLHAVADDAGAPAAGGPQAEMSESTDADAVAILLFTSGTTGSPKAALLRHRHLASYVIATVEFMGAGVDEAQLVSVPPYHVAGLTAVITSIYSGRRIVYLPAFDAESWVACIAEEQITHAMVVPTMLGRILDTMEARNVRLPSLRHLSYGGGRMPIDVIERAMTLLPNVNFVNAYGLTETSSTIAVLGPDDHREAAASHDPAVRGRLRSVGRPTPDVDLEIRSSEGASVPVGTRGEIYVRGEQVSGEYVGRSALTDDGWFPTNDRGSLDEAGFLYLDGRLDDVIVRGGENLSPVEIEEVLVTHEAVAAAAVVGIPDPEWGEAVAAAVVLAAGARVTAPELQQWVRARLRSARTPQVIAFRDELPYNETGKLLRRVLRHELAEISPRDAS